MSNTITCFLHLILLYKSSAELLQWNKTKNNFPFFSETISIMIMSRLSDVLFVFAEVTYAKSLFFTIQFNRLQCRLQFQQSNERIEIRIFVRTEQSVQCWIEFWTLNSFFQSSQETVFYLKEQNVFFFRKMVTKFARNTSSKEHNKKKTHGNDSMKSQQKYLTFPNAICIRWIGKTNPFFNSIDFCCFGFCVHSIWSQYQFSTAVDVVSLLPKARRTKKKKRSLFKLNQLFVEISFQNVQSKLLFIYCIRTDSKVELREKGKNAIHNTEISPNWLPICRVIASQKCNHWLKFVSIQSDFVDAAHRAS